MIAGIRKLIIYFLMGVAFGQLVYVGTLWASGVMSQTVQEMTVVLLLSGLIGIVSLIFETEFLPFLGQFLVHFLLTYGIVCLMNVLTDSSGNLLAGTFLINFILTYVLVWTVVFFITRLRLHTINRRLKELKQNNIDKN